MAEPGVFAPEVHRAGKLFAAGPTYVRQHDRLLMVQAVLRCTLLCTLQQCTFKVDYTLENIPGREFGSVFVNNNNVALKVVSDGWAKASLSPVLAD